MTDYKDHPPSVTELRSEKTNDAADWTPRDALITALRDIDSGRQEPTCLVIIMGMIDESSIIMPLSYVSSPNKFVTAGLLSIALATRIDS